MQNLVVNVTGKHALTAPKPPKIGKKGGAGSTPVLGGVVHSIPQDLLDALVSSTAAIAAWQSLTPLARNEFICWVSDGKLSETRTRRISRAIEELEEGQRRPCCWPGCKHRERTGH